MPIYEYLCSACGVKKEHLQKISDARLTVCPDCGKPTYEKQLTAAGFQMGDYAPRLDCLLQQQKQAQKYLLVP